MKTKLIFSMLFLMAILSLRAQNLVAPVAEKAQKASFDKPDEVRTFSLGKAELIKIAGATIGRAVFQPGWKWSTSLKEMSKTESCEAPHFQYHVQGTLRVKMDDGTIIDCKPGDVSYLPMGHDAWVVGNQAVIVVDFQGMLDYAKTLTTK